MNIVLLSHSLDISGAPLSLLSIAKYLADLGHHVVVISAKNGALCTDYESANVSVYIHHDIYSDTCDISYITSHNPDLIIVNTVLGHNIVKACEHMSTPLLWMIRECNNGMEQLPSVDPHIFSLPDAVVFPSKACQESYQYFGDNASVIYNGIDIEKIDLYCSTHSKADIRNRYGFSDEAYIFTMIGPLSKHKGQDFFIKAAQNLIHYCKNENKNYEVHFLIVGHTEPDSIYAKHCKDLISKEFSQNIHIYPPTDHIYDFYTLSDSIVIASTTEACPRVLLEAMSFAKPIFTTKVGGIPEIVHIPDDAISFTLDYVPNLTTLFLHYIEQESLYKYQSKNAKKRVEESFKEKDMCHAYATLLERILRMPLAMKPGGHSQIDNKHFKIAVLDAMNETLSLENDCLEYAQTYATLGHSVSVFAPRSHIPSLQRSASKDKIDWNWNESIRDIEEFNEQHYDLIILLFPDSPVIHKTPVMMRWQEGGPCPWEKQSTLQYVWCENMKEADALSKAFPQCPDHISIHTLPYPRDFAWFTARKKSWNERVWDISTLYVTDHDQIITPVNVRTQTISLQRGGEQALYSTRELARILGDTRILISDGQSGTEKRIRDAAHFSGCHVLSSAQDDVLLNLLRASPEAHNLVPNRMDFIQEFPTILSSR